MLGLQKSMGVYRYGRLEKWRKRTIKHDRVISNILDMVEEERKLTYYKKCISELIEILYTEQHEEGT